MGPFKSVAQNPALHCVEVRSAKFLRYLFNTHLLELLLPVFGVAVVVVRGRRELAEDAGVPVMAEVCQVGDVELELTAVLGQG